MVNSNTLGQLTEVSDKNYELILPIRNHELIRNAMFTNHIISKAEHKNWWEKSKDKPNCKYLLFYYKQTLTGYLAITQINKVTGTCFWGFFIAPGSIKGCGSKLFALGLDYCFEVLALNKVNSEVLSFNTPSIKLHEKFGFRQEGLFKSHHLHNETLIDIYRFAIFVDDWKTTKPLFLNTLLQERQK